jgi:uncharacterized protein GlcG (DUF336 family)
MRARWVSSTAAVAAFAAAGLISIAPSLHAQGGGSCDVALPSASELRSMLRQAPSVGGDAGGLFHGQRMWAAIVNRNGELCAVAASTDDVTGVWPGSQEIAKAKAYTANAFSVDDLPLSTARLYTFTQPGHSLWSLGQSNVGNSDLLQVPGGSSDRNRVQGGLIFFGGGVPLYRNGHIVGGLGISGDTSCTDHEIAKRVRDLASMNPSGGALADDIVYTESVFAHPLCINTFQNGTKVGEEKTAKY